MIDKSALFDKPIEQDAEGSCFAIVDLCKVGIAATDTHMNVDLSTAYQSLFEAIAALAQDAIERMETKEGVKG